MRPPFLNEIKFRFENFHFLTTASFRFTVLKRTRHEFCFSTSSFDDLVICFQVSALAVLLAVARNIISKPDENTNIEMIKTDIRPY